MPNTIKLKRGLESNRSSTTPSEAELIYTTDEKKVYVGDGSTAGGIPVTGEGNVQIVKGTVDLTSGTAQAIGTLPANADVIRTTMDVTTASDATTTAIVGDTTNGTSSYMAATDNDPEVLGLYISENRVANGGTDRSIIVTVSNPGTVGGATCLVEIRVP
jgi:hypothetical protein